MPHPFALYNLVRKGVSGTFSDELPFHLGQRRHDVEKKPARGGLGVDVVNDGVEGYLMLLKEFNKSYGIFHGTGEPVQLVNNNSIYLAMLHQGDKGLHPLAFQVLRAYAFVGDGFHKDHIIEGTISNNLLPLVLKAHPFPCLFIR